MSESATAARTSSSSLAIAEIKPNNHKPGGCVGIFFQLFDWNRRFSKKKFFPKKLLPPARAKKFNANEKLPVGKHLLIAADENNGGFPSNNSSNVKKNGDRRISLERKKQEMKAPGLVARLMGLEAMPAVPVDRGDDCKTKGGGVGSDKTDSSPEKGNVRPQKIQRTGVSDRKPVTRFGAEALQIRNVLSRSRKHHHHHHPKLASPVKSPKWGRGSKSRLIDAAARILEPGLQATSRARCSLTYSNSMSESRSDCREEEVMSEVKVDMGLHRQCGSKVNAQASCRSCSDFLESMDGRAVVDEQATRVDVPASNFREAFLLGLDESRPRPAAYLKNETEVVLLKTRYRPECVAAQAEEKRSVQNEAIRNGMHQSQCYNQIPANRMFTSQKDESRSLALRHRTQRHGQMMVGDRVPQRAKLGNTQGRRVSPSVSSATEVKDFIALNRNLNRTRFRVPSKADNNIESDRGIFTGKSDPLANQRSPVRKRRTLNASRQVDSAGSGSSMLEKQRSNKGNAVIGNTLRARANSVNQTYVKTRPTSQRGSKDTDVVSFTFSSPVKSSVGTFSHNEMDVEGRDQIGQMPNESMQDKVMMEENGMKKLSHNSLSMNGDALGALLQQKLKELTHQVENEAAAGFVPSARTTASILQELISALTAERPISYADGTHGPETDDAHSGVGSADTVSQGKSRIKRSSDGFSREADHFSPGCVLDASFSNESCISSSIDGSSGHILQSNSMDLSCETVQPACNDADLLDSASSVKKTRSIVLMELTDLLIHTSAVLQNVNLVHAKLTGTKFDYARETVLNAELLFGKADLHSSSKFVDFLLGPFLEELETLVIAAWKNSVLVGLEVRKEESPVRRFLFDCIIECLDVKYSRYSNLGHRAWSRLPKCMNADILVKLFDEEVRKWTSVAGKAPDEIIDREMSTSLGKWTDFETEAYETGSQINQDIVQTLVDEIVIDLLDLN